MAAPRRGGGPSKNEVELARIESQHKVRMAWAYGLTRAACIALAAAPFYALSLSVEPLAGATTRLEINVALGIGFALSVAVNIGMVFKWRSERADIKRLREWRAEHEDTVVTGAL